MAFSKCPFLKNLLSLSDNGSDDVLLITGNPNKIESKQWTQFVWFFWVFELVVRPILGIFLPIDLAGDEAYYWEWGQHLDWGYFSKPPGIAWLMAFADWVGQGSTLGIRLLASILGMGGAWCVVLIAKRCFGHTAAIWIGCAWILTPANSALHLLLTIDAPLVCFWCLALWATIEWIERKGSSLSHAVIIGVAVMCGILSKQMMLIYFPLLVFILILEKDWRPLLAKSQVWIAGIIGHVGLIPPLWWNSQNNWITFQHTLHHFESAPPTLNQRISRFFELFGAEAGLVTPVLFFLILVSGFSVVRQWRTSGPILRLLWWMSFPAILAMLAMTWRQRVNPNWPAVFLIAGTLMGCGYFWKRWENDLKSKNDGEQKPPKNWVKIGVKVSASFTLLSYLFLWLVSNGIVNLPGLDPSARVRQWSNIAYDVSSSAEKHLQQDQIEEKFFWVAIGHRFLTSQLAFFLEGNPRVYRFSPEPDILRSQHDLWDNPSKLIGQNGVIVVRGQPENLPKEIETYFEDFKLLEIISNPQRRKKWRTFSIFYGKNLKNWPEKDLNKARHQ